MARECEATCLAGVMPMLIKCFSKSSAFLHYCHLSENGASVMCFELPHCSSERHGGQGESRSSQLNRSHPGNRAKVGVLGCRPLI